MCRSIGLCILGCVIATPAAAGDATFSVVPVSATGNFAYDPATNEMTVPQGEHQVTFEFFVGGWDPDGDGQPTVRAAQLQFDHAGLASGGTPLTLAAIACSSRSDCAVGSECEPSGFCDSNSAAFIDQTHPRYLFSGGESIGVVDISQPDFRYGVLTLTNTYAVDDGSPRYVGTLLVDVPPEALGTYTFSVLPGDVENFLAGANYEQWGPTAYISARLAVVDDCNLNGTPDDEDVLSGSSPDCNGNLIPDECEPDCDGDAYPDECEIDFGCSADCNADGTPDDCQDDCNNNGIADECDLSSGASTDCNQDAIPDECQPGYYADCNANGTPDLCDIGSGASEDCDNNGMPDECHLAGENDCNGNGIPDSCEPDCNANGVPDDCDLAAGTSVDNNGDGIPDECAAGFAWRPADATTSHIIRGDEIFIPAGGSSITLELQVAWDADLDGSPQLDSYQATLDSSSLQSGSAGALTPAVLPCTSDDDCPLSSRCEPSGTCDADGAAYIDTSRPDFVFVGLPSLGAVSLVDPNTKFGATQIGQVFAIDAGTNHYGATLKLDASADARGVFEIGFTSEETFLMAPQFEVIPIEAMTPARIIVLDDCNENQLPDSVEIAADPGLDCNSNAFIDSCEVALDPSVDCDGNGVPDDCESSVDCDGNGVVDFCDILTGRSEDVNGNGVPDECELSPPKVLAEGSKYLTVTAGAGSDAVALRVTSQDFPCLVAYIQPGGDVGTLSYSATFLKPGAWGTTMVSGAEIIPEAAYEVHADGESGLVADASPVVTQLWGDADKDGDADFQDALELVRAFKGAPCSIGLDRGDIAPYPVPDQKIDFQDIYSVVLSFKGIPYPGEVPCP